MPSSNYRQQKVGRNFETAIANADITRTALAEQLGVHQSSFTYWYKRGVTADYANQVADLLDLDVKDIMSRQTRKSWKRSKSKMAKSVGEIFEVRADKSFPITKIQPPTDPEPRTVNIELLTLIAKMRLSAQQEATLHSLALTFLGEES